MFLNDVEFLSFAQKGTQKISSTQMTKKSNLCIIYSLSKSCHKAEHYDFAREIEVVYYSSGCHSSRCFHVIVLFSPDITPLIQVPDLQSQAVQPEGNVFLLL